MHLSSHGIVEAFTKAIGLTRTSKKTAEPQVLLFDQKWVVNLAEEHHRLVLTASPGQLAPVGDSAAPDWTRLATDTAGITHIGKDPSTGLVMLHASADTAELDAVTFQLWLEQFLVMLEHWNALLTATGSETETPICGSQLLHHALA